MRFNLENDSARTARLMTQHWWFAWRPVRISDWQIAWLEWVLRTGHYHWSKREKRKWRFTYRTALQERGKE